MGAPNRLSFATESHHEIDGLDPSLGNLVFGQGIGLVIEDLCQSLAFRQSDIDDRLLVLLLVLPSCLLLNIPGRTVVEVVLTIFFDDLLDTLCPLHANFIGELPDLFLMLMAFDAVLALLELCTLLFELDDLRVGR